MVVECNSNCRNLFNQTKMENENRRLQSTLENIKWKSRTPLKGNYEITDSFFSKARKSHHFKVKEDIYKENVNLLFRMLRKKSEYETNGKMRKERERIKLLRRISEFPYKLKTKIISNCQKFKEEIKNNEVAIISFDLIKEKLKDRRCKLLYTNDHVKIKIHECQYKIYHLIKSTLCSRIIIQIILKEVKLELLKDISENKC